MSSPRQHAYAAPAGYRPEPAAPEVIYPRNGDFPAWYQDLEHRPDFDSDKPLCACGERVELDTGGYAYCMSEPPTGARPRVVVNPEDDNNSQMPGWYPPMRPTVEYPCSDKRCCR